MLSTLLAVAPIPKHPDSTMPYTPEIVFTIFLGIPVVIGLFFAVRHLLTGKGPLLLMCLFGGAIACLWEPIVDTMGLCYIKEDANITTFSSMGRDFPLFINFVYIWYVGGLAYLAYRIFSNGITKKALFLLYAMDACINIFLESPGVLMGAYEYYGPQPLNFWGLPLWWVMVNPLMPMIIGALIYRLKPYMPGWKIVAIVPLIPMSDGLANAATAWPVWTALNRDESLFVTHIATAITLALALYVVWILSLVVARPESEVAETTKLGIIKAAVFGVPDEARVPAVPEVPRETRTPAPA
ncbi:hypothetical protein DSM112329_04637 [Paraconexibacter sp. AEG42_29]|uniref:Carotenoid biosynthesis protein n=1 Tax=Paraconexibacter sp. AEG42_29 TaxID=2997339 RepID=A0AAU7B2B6_9ACTN